MQMDLAIKPLQPQQHQPQLPQQTPQKWIVPSWLLYLWIKTKRLPWPVSTTTPTMGRARIRIWCSLAVTWTAWWIVNFSSSSSSQMNRETFWTSWTKKNSVTLLWWWRANQSTVTK
jgi:hypothetical protein